MHLGILGKLARAKEYDALMGFVRDAPTTKDLAFLAKSIADVFPGSRVEEGEMQAAPPAIFPEQHNVQIPQGLSLWGRTKWQNVAVIEADYDRNKVHITLRAIKGKGEGSQVLFQKFAGEHGLKPQLTTKGDLEWEGIFEKK